MRIAEQWKQKYLPPQPATVSDSVPAVSQPQAGLTDDPAVLLQVSTRGGVAPLSPQRDEGGAVIASSWWAELASTREVALRPG